MKIRRIVQRLFVGIMAGSMLAGNVVSPELGAKEKLVVKEKACDNQRLESLYRDYIVMSKNAKKNNEVMAKYKKNIKISHRKKDEKYLNKINVTSLKLKDKQRNEIIKDKAVVIEKDYNVCGLEKEEFKSTLEQVPETLSEYKSRHDVEYSDNPKAFVPCRSVKGTKKDNEVLPWNIEVVAGDPRKNQYTGKGIKVAVIDSGIDVHDDLNTNEWIDFSDEKKGYKPIDNNGHGTEMAGVIAARDNGIGTIGIAPDATLYSVKILDENNISSVSCVIKAINWCINNDIDVINMSFGMNEYSQILQETIQKAYKKNITMIAAAGNKNELQYPAGYDEVISVGGINKQLEIEEYSPKGKSVDVYAPSEKAQTTGFLGTYTKSNGTSIAAAHVTGVISAIKSIDKKISNKELKEVITSSAIEMSDENNNYGIVNYTNAENYFNSRRAIGIEEEVEELDKKDVSALSDNNSYVKGSWSADNWNGVSRAKGTGHYTMINTLDTKYFEKGAANYTQKTYNRWIVADSAFRTDFSQFTKWPEIDKKETYRYPPYHANTHYSSPQLYAPINFLYELSRRRLVLGSQLSMDSSAYNNKDEYKGVYIPVVMKKRIVDDMKSMYQLLKVQYATTNINMDNVYSRGYMVLGVLLHMVQDFYCHRARVTREMLSSSDDGIFGQNDAFGATNKDSSISLRNIDGNGSSWDNYWKCFRYIKKYGGLPISRLKERLNYNISINCNGNNYTFITKLPDVERRNQPYEDNPFFYSNRYEASLYVTEAVLNDMKEQKGSTTLYGFESWGVPLYETKFDYKFEGEKWVPA